MILFVMMQAFNWYIICDTLVHIHSEILKKHESIEVFLDRLQLNLKINTETEIFFMNQICYQYSSITILNWDMSEIVKTVSFQWNLL